MFFFSIHRNNSREIVECVHGCSWGNLPNFVRCSNGIQKEISDFFVKHVTTVPMKFQRLLIGMFHLNNHTNHVFPDVENFVYFNSQKPIGFRLKWLNFIMSIHTKSKCGCLAWSIRYTTTIQITIFALEEPQDLRKKSINIEQIPEKIVFETV